MKPVIKKHFSVIYKTSLLLKGLTGILELFSGIVVLSVSKAHIITSVLNLLQNEISNDPKDFLANFIVNSAAAFSVSSQYLIAFYLIFHGIIKIFIIINILRQKLWAYPVGIVFFSLFIFYYIYKMYFSHVYSSLLILSMVLDIFILIFVIIDYIEQKNQRLISKL